MPRGPEIQGGWLALSLASNEYRLGDPIVADVTLGNQRRESILFRTCSELQRASFDIVDEASNLVEESEERIAERDELNHSDFACTQMGGIPSEETLTESLPVSRMYRICKPGRYRITARRKIVVLQVGVFELMSNTVEIVVLAPSKALGSTPGRNAP